MPRMKRAINRRRKYQPIGDRNQVVEFFNLEMSENTPSLQTQPHKKMVSLGKAWASVQFRPTQPKDGYNISSTSSILVTTWQLENVSMNTKVLYQSEYYSIQNIEKVPQSVTETGSNLVVLSCSLDGDQDYLSSQQ